MKSLTGIILLVATANLLAAGIGLNPTGIDMGSNPISNLAEPVIPSDAATKSYVDSNTESRIPIDTANFAIDSPGSYYLTGDLEAIGTNGITVNARNVTIDMMGYSVVGDGSERFGISILTNQSNITIRNGRITGFGRSGIHGFGSNNFIRIENVFVASNGSAGTGLEFYSGIYFDSEHVDISNCTVAYSGYNGISLGERSRIINNTVISSGNIGIFLYGDESFVAENSVLRSGGVGIQIRSGAVVNNFVSFNIDDGIQALTRATITGNTSTWNHGSGINAGSGAQIKDNNVRQNDGNGIQTSAFATITGNSVGQNAENGIKATDASIVGNMISENNTSDGVFLAGIYASGASRVSDNTIINNAKNNIYVTTSSSVIIENNQIANSTNGIRFGSAIGSAFRDNTFKNNATTYFNLGTNVDDGGNLVY